MEGAAEARPRVSISAKVFRIDWNRRPKWISESMWLAMGRRRIFFTGHWEDHGVIATSEDGSASIEPISSK